jgi:hypothetical protein
VEKYGTARQATDDNIIQRMRFACRITKATDTHSEYVIFLLFHGNNGYANAPQCYVTRTLHILVSKYVQLNNILISGSGLTFVYYYPSLFVV